MAAKRKANKPVAKKSAKKVPAKKIPAKKILAKKPPAKKKAVKELELFVANRAKQPWSKRKFKALSEVRAAIDAMDEKIVPLLSERLFYVTQAAQFKPSVKGVVIVPRVEEVVRNARVIAEATGGRPDTIEEVYRVLIDAFTADEQRQWRANHGRK